MKGGGERRRRQGLSLERFVHAKKHDASIVEEIKRKEARRKAKIVQSYQRLLRREGYEAQGGAAAAEPEPVKEQAGSKRKRSHFLQQKGKGKGQDAFKKAKREAQTKEQAAKDREEREKERLAKLKRKEVERKRMNRKLKERTRKGQPIMKHKIELLLQQVERQVGR